MTELYTFVAGGSLEADTPFNITCQCGGTATIVPHAVTGYGYAKKGPTVRVVDQLKTRCQHCNATIKANVLEGDPGYLLIEQHGVEALFRPQGSTAVPVEQLTEDQYRRHLHRLKQID